MHVGLFITHNYKDGINVEKQIPIAGYAILVVRLAITMESGHHIDNHHKPKGPTRNDTETMLLLE